MLARALAGHHAAGGVAVRVRLAVGVVQHLEREQLHRAPAGAAASAATTTAVGEAVASASAGAAASAATIAVVVGAALRDAA